MDEVTPNFHQKYKDLIQVQMVLEFIRSKQVRMLNAIFCLKSEVPNISPEESY
jgi:hypothetical protein